MKPTKKQKAEYLFDALGNVSDAFLGEVLAYRAKPKRQVNLKWPISIAAVLLVLVIALPVIWNSVAPDKGPSGETNAGGLNAPSGSNDAPNNNGNNTAIITAITTAITTAIIMQGAIRETLQVTTITTTTCRHRQQTMAPPITVRMRAHHPHHALHWSHCLQTAERMPMQP